jgi:hypothetical protein
MPNDARLAALYNDTAKPAGFTLIQTAISAAIAVATLAMLSIASE